MTSKYSWTRNQIIEFWKQTLFHVTTILANKWSRLQKLVPAMARHILFATKGGLDQEKTLAKCSMFIQLLLSKT